MSASGVCAGGVCTSGICVCSVLVLVKDVLDLGLDLFHCSSHCELLFVLVGYQKGMGEVLL